MIVLKGLGVPKVSVTKKEKGASFVPIFGQYSLKFSGSTCSGDVHEPGLQSPAANKVECSTSFYCCVYFCTEHKKGTCKLQRYVIFLSTFFYLVYFFYISAYHFQTQTCTLFSSQPLQTYMATPSQPTIPAQHTCFPHICYTYLLHTPAALPFPAPSAMHRPGFHRPVPQFSAGKYVTLMAWDDHYYAHYRGRCSFWGWTRRERESVCVCTGILRNIVLFYICFH